MGNVSDGFPKRSRKDRSFFLETTADEARSKRFIA